MLIWFIFLSISFFLGIILAFIFSKKNQTRLDGLNVMNNVNAILERAHEQRKFILKEAKKTAREGYAIEKLRIEENVTLANQTQKNKEIKIQSKYSETERREFELNNKIKNITHEKQTLKENEIYFQNLTKKTAESQIDYEKQIENKIGLTKMSLKKDMIDEIIHNEKFKKQRITLENQESLRVELQRRTMDILNAIYFRYQPDFVWPKSAFVVQGQSKEILEKHFYENSPLIQTLLQGTDTTISILTIHDTLPSIIKITGGFGLDKEVIRLTIDEFIARQIFEQEKILTIMQKHRNHLESSVLRLGAEAIKTLNLKKTMHPELLRLIGCLNFRTSHRQNQYYHSLEVATLAGMLAHEIGVDPIIAKRSGILHDIGKVLDYKIEGSHAVISADYALRFGESEDVIDPVLAHHDDKLVETPYAYIIKTADSMSGARPGARIDMEEGYNRRIDGISGVVNSFQNCGVTGSAIMHAGREVHIYVDNHKIKQPAIGELAENIAEKLEREVEYPGQIRVTVIRRTEVCEVA